MNALVPFTDLRRRLWRWMDDSLFSWMTDLDVPVGATGLELDVTEDSHNYIVQASLPGVSKDNINVSMTGNVLTISAESKNRYEDRGRSYYIRELSYGRFARSIRLPAEVNADRAEAELKDGVLTVRLPKARPSPLQKIVVKAQKLLKGDRIAVKGS